MANSLPGTERLVETPCRDDLVGLLNQQVPLPRSHNLPSSGFLKPACGQRTEVSNDRVRQKGINMAIIRKSLASGFVFIVVCAVLGWLIGWGAESYFQPKNNVMVINANSTGRTGPSTINMVGTRAPADVVLPIAGVCAGILWLMYKSQKDSEG